ncbi:hypothetical protein JW968_02565 [Candidatus Woesearchaeota archaeon]|nr:hypothetical protein [Candidatus Woesearchaeota archaeon]
MNRKIFIFFLVILVFSVILSGCGGKECEKKSDCQAKTCFDSSCVDGKCVYSPQQNCCGNKVCEDSENECTCMVDCGKCGPKGNATAFTGLEYSCGPDNDQCALDVKGSKTRTPVTFAKSTFDFKTDIKMTLDQPFDVKSSVFDVELEITDMSDGIEDFMISKIQVLGSSGTGFAAKEFVIGEKELNRPMWGPGASMKTEIIATCDFPQPESLQTLAVKVFYEYRKTSFGSEKTVRDSFTEKASAQYNFLVPTRVYVCDDVDCNDNNPATKDECIEGTLLCTHDPIPNRCGNFICESNENKCSCPGDCGPCDGQISDHMTAVCYQNDCQSKLAQQSLSTLSAELSYTKFKINMESNFNDPFNVNKDSFDIKLELVSVSPDLATVVTINKIELVEGELLLGKIDLFSENTLQSIRDMKSFSIPVNFPLGEDEESQKQVKVRVHCAYQYSKFGGQMENVFDEIKEYQFRSKVNFANADI